MPHSESRTYPSHLRRYLTSLESENVPRPSRYCFKKKSKPSAKRKKRRTNGHNGQLSFPLTTIPSTQARSNPLRKHDQMANFQDILNRPSEEIKPAPTLPMGSYHSIVVGLPEQGESSKKKTPFLKFTHKIIAPLDDVDPDAITEFEAEGETIVGQEIENTLYVTDKSANMLKEFLINCGVDLTGRSMAEGLDEVPNAEVIINIKHEASDDGKRVYSKVGSTARVS